jgi:hypothetical protein
MKLKLFSLGLFSVAAVAPLLMPSFTHKAQAVCVAVDTNVQVAVHGQKRGSRAQSNQTNQNFGANCKNGVSSVRSSGTQICVSQSCRQNRTSDQFVDGDKNGVRNGGRNIRVSPSVQVEVYSPAQDPKFMNRVRGGR